MRLYHALILTLALPAMGRADESFTHAAAHLEKGEGTALKITITGLGEAVLKACAARDAKSPEWEKAARVQIAGGSDAELAQRPAILGTWRVSGTELCFEPRFPFLAGASLRITIDPPLLIDPKSGKSTPLTFNLELPKKDLTPVTKIENIYPTKKVLPENQLRFYIHFSHPMERGDAYEHIKLLDAKGKPIENVFLELPEELWDTTMTRFTLLFHPGRVKQGLKPREELGPILEAGKSYTLLISGKWKDAEGRTLAQKEFRKSFTAGPADEEKIDPKKWKILPPAAGTAQPLQVRFNESLDHGLLHRVLWIVDGDGKKIAGKISVSEEETLWSFTPEKPWQAGRFKLVADVILEDLAANRIDRLFEVDIFRPIPKSNEPKTVELPLEIRLPTPEPRK